MKMMIFFMIYIYAVIEFRGSKIRDSGLDRLTASAFAAGAGSDLFGDDIDVDFGVHDGFVTVEGDISDGAGVAFAAGRAAGENFERSLQREKMLQAQKLKDLVVGAIDRKECLRVDFEEFVDGHAFDNIEQQRVVADALAAGLFDELIVLESVAIIDHDLN